MSERLHRRSLLGMLTAVFLWPCGAVAARMRRALTGDTEAAAIQKGKELGVGSIRLDRPRSVEVLSHQTFRLIYTAGPAGIRPGGGLRIGMRHLQRHVALPQISDPVAANYTTATTNRDLRLKIEVPDGWKVFMTQYFAWQNIVQVTLPEGVLKSGEQLAVTLGDRRGGGPGMRVQPYDETHYAWKCYVDVTGDGQYLPLETTPAVRVVAAQPYRIRAVMPSDAVVGEPTWCIVRAEDRYGNPAPRFRGTVRLESADSSAHIPAPHVYTAEDGGVYQFEGIRFSAAGVHRLQTQGTGDERFDVTANPVRVVASRPDNLLLWGDLHGHTLFSDGRGTVEEYYDFARRVVGLDFCAVTDHAFQIVDQMWAHSKAVTNRANVPGEFVTFNAYEWSGVTADGGDHNCYFLEDDPPIYRSTLMYDPRNLQMDHDDAKVRTVMELFDKLVALLNDKNVLCIPHSGGRRGNPQWHDPRVQRLIEVFSDHRRSEEWVGTFLAAGHRVGIMASTDNHYGNPGYGYLNMSYDWDKQEIGTSAIAVYAQERTRESIFHALYDRHTYATSGPRIILEFRADDHFMGSEMRAERAPILSVRAVGTTQLSHLEIKKNDQVARRIPCHDLTAEFEWQDPDFDPEQPVYYYVRVVQADGEEAISSPIWVNVAAG